MADRLPHRAASYAAQAETLLDVIQDETPADVLARAQVLAILAVAAALKEADRG